MRARIAGVGNGDMFGTDADLGRLRMGAVERASRGDDQRARTCSADPVEAKRDGATFDAPGRDGKEVHGGRADERCDEFVVRPGIKLQRRADLRDDAAIEHDDAVGQRHRLDLVVGDVDHGGPERLVELGQFDAHLHAQQGVEVGQRLVEQENFRLAGQRPADGDALALAAGQLRRFAVHQLVKLQQRCDFVRALRLHCLRGAGDRQRKRDIVAHREMRIERVGLEHHGDAPLGRVQPGDIGAVDEDRALGDLLQPGDHAQHRRLAAAGWPEQRAEFALADCQVEIGDGGDVAVALADGAHLDMLHLPLQSLPADLALDVHASTSHTIIEPFWRLFQR